MKIHSSLLVLRERALYALARAFRFLGLVADKLGAIIYLTCGSLVIPVVALFFAWAWLSEWTGNWVAGAGLTVVCAVIVGIGTFFGEPTCYNLGLFLTAKGSPRAKKLLEQAYKEWNDDTKPGSGW